MITVLLCLILTSGTLGVVHRVCLKRERVAKMELDARVLALPEPEPRPTCKSLPSPYGKDIAEPRRSGSRAACHE